MPFADKLSQLTKNEKYKKVETSLWRAFDPLGKGMNKIAGSLGAESFYPCELAEGEIDKAARILRTFTLEGASADDSAQAERNGGVAAAATNDPHAAKKTQKVLRKIPAKAIQGACGVAIFTCFRTGLGWSGASGSGLVVARLEDGSWSPPSGILIHTLAYGLLFGVDIYDAVLIIRKPSTLHAFTNPKISVGAEFSAAAGPVGNGAVLDAGLDAKPVWSYTKSKGVYVGVQLDGTVILSRDDANGRFYGRNGPVTPAEVFSGSVSTPPAAKPLLQTLYAAEGRPQVLGVDAIPSGQTPGDRVLNEQEIQAIQHEAHAGQDGAMQHSAGQSDPFSHTYQGSTASVAAPQGELPPAYSDDMISGPPPPADHGASLPRDAAAEKEAMRRHYEQADTHTAGSSHVTGATSSGFPSQVRAQYDFVGTEAGDLSFKEGDIIDVHGKEGEQWFRGSLNGHTGIFPANYVA